MVRLAAFIRQAGAQLDAITVTLDSHHRLDIAHPGFWRAPAGRRRAVHAHHRGTGAGGRVPAVTHWPWRTLAYLDELEARGRYTLMVWPVRCEIGSWGHGMHADVHAACAAWEDQGRGSVQGAQGRQPWTEHYSAVMAEVPDAADPARR